MSLSTANPWLPGPSEPPEDRRPLNREETAAAVAKMRPYWHSPIDFGHGIVMKNWLAQRRFRRRQRIMKLPEDLSGKRVLDIGTWDGFFSWEMEKRGAGSKEGENFAIDFFCKEALEQFLFVRKVRGSNIQYKRLDVHELNPASEGEFDFILCAGVLYHCRYPLAALEAIRKVCRGQLVLETVCMIPIFHSNFPMIAFFPGDGEALSKRKGGKKRRWHISAAATVPWLVEALYSAGFSKVEVVYKPSCSFLKKIYALFKGRPEAGRVVLHAFV